MSKKFLSISILIILFAELVYAIPKNLPVPRFVTIKFDEVNARIGPDKNNPIDWVFVKKGEPVEVIAEYEQWRKIIDIHKQGGWVHSSVISGNRSVIIKNKNNVMLLSSPASNKVIANLEPNLRCKFIKSKDEWCKLSCSDYTGWVNKKFLWGVYPKE